MIIDEVEQQLSNGTIIKRNGKIKFDCHNSNCDVEITETKLCLRDDWGFIDEIWIEEIELIGA